jgi:cyclopropane-fatty-acyl-phospholipid synthase
LVFLIHHLGEMAVIGNLYARVQRLSIVVLAWLQITARSFILHGLQTASVNCLLIKSDNGFETSIGSKCEGPTPSCLITVHDDLFWLRVLLLGDIGFAQSYMLGEIEARDLTAVFQFFIQNTKHMGSSMTSGVLLFARKAMLAIFRAANRVSTAKRNAEAHYSLSNDMFAAFLSPDMTYSSAIWLPASNPESDSDTLEAAQLRKLRYAIATCRIKAADHVLEIGTGWGSFAILAARETKCRITTVTPSAAQKALAEERIAAAGLSDRVTVVQADYRELLPHRPKGGFDKIVSIEMIEHVGHDFLPVYFACMDRYLKSDGIAYFQCITIPEARYAAYRKSEDFIKRYIFPGGHLPTVSGLVASIDHGSYGRLVVEEVKSFAAHYGRTLRCWKEKFLDNFDDQIRRALLQEYPHMSKAELEVFRRKWEVGFAVHSCDFCIMEPIHKLLMLWQYYFSYCEAGFESKSLGVVGITIAREGCVEVLEDFVKTTTQSN